METVGNRCRQKVTRIFAVISFIWVFLLFGCLATTYLGIGNPEPFSIRFAEGGGVIIIGAVVLMLHILLILAVYKKFSTQISKIVLLVSSFGMGIMTILTGFSIGTLLLPSAILIILTSILFLTIKIPREE